MVKLSTWKEWREYKPITNAQVAAHNKAKSKIIDQALKELKAILFESETKDIAPGHHVLITQLKPSSKDNIFHHRKLMLTSEGLVERVSCDGHQQKDEDEIYWGQCHIPDKQVEPKDFKNIIVKYRVDTAKLKLVWAKLRE